jgi:hypothetical protein
MALNLNKDGADKPSPSSEKKGLNLTKSGSSKNEGKDLNKSKESSKTGLNLSKDKIHQEDNSSSHVVPSNDAEVHNSEKKKSPLLLIGFIAIIALGIFWFMNKGDGDSQIKPEVNETPAVASDSLTPQVIVNSDTVNSEQPIVTDNSSADSPTSTTPNPTNTVEVNNQNNSKLNNSSSSNIRQTKDATDDKVKQVLDGVYGNGIERKRALGSEYQEIQAKVNEMYRNKR